MSRPSENPPAIPSQSLEQKRISRNPWWWIPSLYFAEGLPYVVVMTVSVIMYKGMGISNTDIALYTSWLYLPWVIKPLWSPVVDILKTRRLWIWTMQLLIGAGLAGVALTIPAPRFFQYTLAFLWLLAFSSATHDIAADGFYMLATTEAEQAFFVGIRSTFYRISMVSGQGLLVILAGLIQSHTGLPEVRLQVEAQLGAAIEARAPNPDAFTVPSSVAAKGPVYVVASTNRIYISSDAANSADIKQVLAFAKEWNLTNGFNRVTQKSAVQEKKDESPSLWSRRVSGPFGTFLKEHFGAERKKINTAGNVGVAYLRLSQPPGRQTVLNLAVSGAATISLAEGARLVFDDTNWNKPAMVVFQLDPKLRSAASAVAKVRSGNIPLSWVFVFSVLLLLFIVFGVWHKFILPRPDRDRAGAPGSLPVFMNQFWGTFVAFFKKDRIGILLLFLLFYRFGEAQLVKLVTPFLLDGREVGGLGLTTSEVGFVYGTVGIIALTCGGLLGGMVASRKGLKYWLWPMVLVMHLPDAVFVYLAHAQPTNLVLINICIAIEQFGYGFGFTAYMLYMIYIARGKHETAHYAICTGFMALSMMLPGMFSGWLQDIIGYKHFFIWVMLATIPSFIVAGLVPLDAEFGKKARG